jgi:glucokinase
VDADGGIVRDAPNLVGFHNVPLGPRLAAALDCRVVVENDANAAAYGEYWAGAGRGIDGPGDLVLLTLGTGVGGGIISGGRVLHGCRGLAGEVGHMIVADGGRLCGCGQRGCLEAYASAAAVAAQGAAVGPRDREGP